MKPDLLRLHPELVVKPADSLRQAMEAMTRTQFGIVLVVGPGRRLLGVITDIDIRKALLGGGAVETPVSRVMNKRPITVLNTQGPEEVADVFRAKAKAYLPIVDAKGRLKGLTSLKDHAQVPQRYPNWVVVMAGGAGKRLLPLTKSTPKPMLRLGDKPILEHLLEQFAASGFSHYIFTVNYLGDQIREYFGDGSRWNVQIEYVREAKPLGTVGSLSLIKREFKAPLIVANGDILTKVNFSALLDFHRAEKGLATLCVKRHEIQVPYGVVELDGHRLDAFVEKPVHRLLVNAGIYVLEPKVLSWLSKNKPCDMPDFLREIGRRKRGGVACFPIQEYWLDIGGMKEFERAAGEFESIFEGK